MSRHGGPETFGFWKSILIALVGMVVIIIGLSLFEKSIIATLILVAVGSLIIMIAAEAGKGRMRGLFTDPHTFAKVKPKDGQYKDMPHNPWDAVSGEKDK